MEDALWEGHRDFHISVQCVCVCVCVCVMCVCVCVCVMPAQIWTTITITLYTAIPPMSKERWSSWFEIVVVRPSSCRSSDVPLLEGLQV